MHSMSTLVSLGQGGTRGTGDALVQEPMKLQCIRIKAPSFCAGIDCEGRRSAPILRFMKGWTLGQIKAYCEVRGWQMLYW